MNTASPFVMLSATGAKAGFRAFTTMIMMTTTTTIITGDGVSG